MSVASQPVLDPPVHGKGGLALKRDERRAAAVGCGAHALHDGYTDLIYVMLPIWQREFGLGFAELGLLRALFSGTMAGLQIPSGLIAERLGTAAARAPVSGSSPLRSLSGAWARARSIRWRRR